MIENLPYPSVERIIEVTRFKDEATAKGALATLKWLDRGAPHKVDNFDGKLEFDMSVYQGRLYDEKDNNCGTACCIAGAITLFSTISGDRAPGYQNIQTQFGFNNTDLDDELTQLFFPRYVVDGMVCSGVKRKLPSEAAATLRQYLFTGKVDWRD